MAALTIPQPLFDKLGKQESDNLLELIVKAVEGSEAKTIEKAGDKFEKRLTEEIGSVKLDIANLDKRLTEEIGSVRADIQQLVWKILVGVGTLLLIQTGFILAVIRYLHPN